jgi:hypothetical protein
MIAEASVAGRLAVAADERLEGEGEIADDRMMEALGAGLVQAHVVGGPACAELVAARRELADEVGQVVAVWVAAGLSSSPTASS